METGNKMERRKKGREAYSTDGEIYLESSVFKAKIIDCSENGVRFEMKKPLKVRVRFKVGEKRIDRIAKFVWTMDREDGDNIFGFKFDE
jgi:PilZ domain